MRSSRSTGRPTSRRRSCCSSSASPSPKSRSGVGVSRPARLQHDGQVALNGMPYDLGDADLPAGTSLELLVESGGRLRGRFLMQPEPGVRPTREQLLVAAALADQVGAALAASYPAAT